MLGEGALLLDCAERLREHGFQLNGIFSGDEQVRRYCAETDSIYLDSRSAFAAALTQTPFDYLFSINNSYLLPASVLGLPRQQVINYHDSPLAAYAGVNATFWALVNGETEHGVTWHLVDVSIDTGDILVQHRFAIDPNTTSIQLNMRCYQAAVDSSKELIRTLRAGWSATGHGATYLCKPNKAPRSVHRLPATRRPDCPTGAGTGFWLSS